MSLPVSQYEALLAEMRGLRRKAQRVQQIAKPLIQGDSSVAYSSSEVASDSGDIRRYRQQNFNNGLSEPLDYTMESLLMGRHTATSPNGVASSTEGDTGCSEDEYGGSTRSSTKLSVSSEPTPDSNRISGLYHGTWPVERTMWNSEPTSLGTNHSNRRNIGNQMEVNSVMSFASSSGGVPFERVLGSPDRKQQLEAKMDVVHSLLSMLGGQDHIDMGETLLALSTCPESCLAMRQSGCIPLLVQLVQSDRDEDTRKKAAQALHNLVNSQPDEKLRKRESRVLKLLEHCRAYVEALKSNVNMEQLDICSNQSEEDSDKHPVQTVAHLMKLSFDEGHRQAICQLGGIHTIATLVEVEHSIHLSNTTNSYCVLMRRYACMALTNLTFGDSGNKALLCSFKDFMKSLVVQLQSDSDELRQVTASVLRNLSWRADSTSKEILREVGSVSGLMKAAMLDNKENTLKSILSALWNLSAHCTENKSEICAVDGALGYLVDLLTYKSPTKSLAIIENSGGILRNISSQIAVRDDYRCILRKHNCLQILLEQLKSPSLTIVSNACGTLWNLSAKCKVDQEALWQMGAPTMLSSLNHSKHKMIAMGSSAALKNLMSAKPQHMFQPQLDATALSLDLPALPTLGARKQKAFMQNLDHTLSETFENIEKESPVKKDAKMQELSSNFSSLNLNEPSTSYSSDSSNQRLRMSQSYGSASLPYKRANCTFIPVRNKYSDCDYSDELEVSDQPIDYSKKYSETKVQIPENNFIKEQNYSYSKPPNDKESFGIYAETDLDQPTDYSLRYAEDDSDSEIAKNEDTVKTYCTEDTPYETPFNFSTATSMSDLRMDDKQIIDNDKLKDAESKSSKKINEGEEEKERCSTEDISVLDHRTKIAPKSELSSGLMSPEKPINYADEGTPGYFSRVSSFGSLNSIPVKESKEEESDIKAVEKTSKAGETKAVKFEGVVNYAEETPLMFSRSSSLASLDSIEQHSIHDDRSSVISDFSRLTSGIVSPSELPDSPTQTVPPSPKPRKSMEFPSSSKGRGNLNSERIPQPAPRSIPKPTVFEDHVTKFKEESTPIQFSTATSLSSLTIDEDVQVVEKPDVLQSEDKVENEEVEKKDEEKETEGSDLNDVESDVDEDILADCINIGMQTNRHSQVTKPITTSTPTKLPVSNFKYSTKSVQSSGIPITRIASRVQNSNFDTHPVNQIDSVRTYCTEDTPVRLSNAASNSDLSLLSVSNGKDGSRKGDYLSDDSSNLSGENDNILAECIQSAMPKAKKIPKPAIATSLLRRHEAPKVPPSNETNRRHHPVDSNPSDELASYAVENSPCHFSLRSSLSDLTVDGSVAALKRTSNNDNETQEPKAEKTENNETQSANSTIQHNVSQQSRRESLSSISVESLGSIEAEQALLAQCISSGMPQSHSKPIDIPKSSSRSSLVGSASHSKNVSAASVAGSTRDLRAANDTSPIISQSNAVAGVEKKVETQQENGTKEVEVVDAKNDVDRVRGEPERTGIQTRSIQGTGTSPDKCSPTEETSYQETARNGSSDSLQKILDVMEDRLIRSCEESKVIDSRMHDPDAMIESLDRFTAELVSQASHLNQNETYNKYDNTWNDDISPNDVTFPSLSGSVPNVITFDSNHDDDVKESKEPSLDYSSINTSTMTESTLIAIEATRVATAFKHQAEMSASITSIELDNIQPPSQLNSLSNSSPKLPRRKKSLPMLKRAFSNSLNNGSSLESLSNLDHVNPPSDLLLDMEGSMNSVASLPHDQRPDFLINGVIHNNVHSIFDTKQPYSELENINPPSLFNEITDFCNSLADVPTDEINSETMFEDCFSQLDDTIADDDGDNIDEDDVTIYSDAKSSLSPKKKSLSKSMSLKQRRNEARDRYKTYTIGAEIIMREEAEKQKELPDSTTDVKLTPKERRQNDRSRYETQVIDGALLDLSQEQQRPVIESPTQSPKNKSSIRRSFMQKRLENRDRFRTRTISDISECSSHDVLNGDSDMQLHLQKEANRVLKTLRDTKTQEEMLDCETLSLVSNDDDSEHNSISSVNYRTYHKSWVVKKNLPVVTTHSAEVKQPNDQFVPEIDTTAELEVDETLKLEIDEEEEEKRSLGKPKIVIPAKDIEVVEHEEEEQPKGIRGRRKPLYSKTVTSTTPKNIKPVRNMTSNLVKNVTSTLKSGIGRSVNKNVASTNQSQSRASSGYGSRASPKTSPARTYTKSTPASSKTQVNQASPLKASPQLERQGTFTKDEPSSSSSPTCIPKPTSKIPTVSKIPSASKIPGKPPVNKSSGYAKSASSSTDRSVRNPKVYNRSTSADSRDHNQTARRIQASPSTQSLKSDSRGQQNGAVKKSSIPSFTQRSNSNSSLTSTNSTTVKKQVTSKIASLWKKIEDTKKQPPKKDGRVWIQPEEQHPRLIRSNTFDNKDSTILKQEEGNVNTVPTLNQYYDEADGLSTDSF